MCKQATSTVSLYWWWINLKFDFLSKVLFSAFDYKIRHNNTLEFSHNFLSKWSFGNTQDSWFSWSSSTTLSSCHSLFTFKKKNPISDIHKLGRLLILYSSTVQPHTLKRIVPYKKKRKKKILPPLKACLGNSNKAEMPHGWSQHALPFEWNSSSA